MLELWYAYDSMKSMDLNAGSAREIKEARMIDLDGLVPTFLVLIVAVLFGAGLITGLYLAHHGIM